MSTPRSIHVMGAGGPGMSALARLLHEMGHRVTACDLRVSEVTSRLERDGISVMLGNDDSHVGGMDIVTYSSAMTVEHHELRAAQALGVATYSRAEALRIACSARPTIGVAGTHGKTTTTAMLSAILIACGKDPSYLIGGDTVLPGSNAHWGAGEVLVVEADESDSTHLQLPLRGAIVTNVDLDHLDNFGSFEEILRSFEQFVDSVDGPVMIGYDDPRSRQLMRERDVMSFGVEGGDYRAVDVELRPGRAFFNLEYGSARCRVEIEQRGLHNVRNALGAISMAHRWGVDLDEACAAIRNFQGVARRFDVRGSARGAMFVDDYAHLPAEIASTLAAARAEAGDRRIIAVFQPNRFNRMDKMSADYRDAFVEADVTVITEIYASGTLPIEGVSGSLVVDAIRSAHPSSDVRWCPTRSRLIDEVVDVVGEGDICISMGCGDIEHLPGEVMKRIGIS